MGIRNEITLRPARPEDEAFLYRVYASTRDEELMATGWDEAQKEAFLRMQHHAQDSHFKAAYGDGDFLIIERGEKAIGRLYIHRTEVEICVVDIALLPEERGHGIGGALMEDVIRESEAARKPVRLYVEVFNRAASLYDRLGFTPIAEVGVYKHMERIPQNTA